MRVDLDSGFIERPEAPPEVAGISSPVDIQAQVESSGARRVRETVEAALAGTLPLDEPLARYEVQKFSPVHISLVLDRCQGMTPTELCEKYGMHYQYVTILLRHPFARQIQAAVLSQLADRCADPMERMKAYANEMIDVKMEIVRDKTTPKVLRNSVASDILDRAGYGARQKVDATVVTPTQPSVPSGLLGRLVSALETSQRVATVDYSRHSAVSARKGDSVADKDTPLLEPGSSVESPEASLGGPPSAERVA